MTKRSTKHSLIMSAIALLLCFSMLIGTTFAWFTDSVTSANNIIKSGTLDVTLHYAEGTKAVPSDVADWNDAATGTIFNYDNWEPGYTDVKHIRIGNNGTLALKYVVTITAYDEFNQPVAPDAVNSLAEVIDVYYLDPAQQVADRNAFDALSADKKLGTLKDVLANLNSTATGTLEAGDSDEITLALKMQESAGNEYQDKSIGENFAITVFATQMTYESDSFDNQYDKDAYLPVVYNLDEFKAAIENGESVKLGADVTTAAAIEVPADANIVIDLNGKTLSGTAIKQKHVLVNNGTLTITGGTIASLGDDGGSAIVNKGTLHASGLTLNGAPFVGLDGVWYPSYVVNNSGTMTLTDSVITGEHGGVAATAGGNVTLNNVNVTVGKNGITNAALYTYGGKITVNGGTYTNRAIDQNATGASVINGSVTVNAGTFNGRIENYYGTPVIKGGTFSVEPKANFTKGYKVTNNGNGTWTVGAYEVSSEVEFADAIANGKAVELTQDIDLGKIDLTGAITNDVAINANGHKITTTDAYGVEVTAGKNVTISNADVVMTKEGDYITYAAGLKIANGDYAGSTITLENCDITMANTDWAYAVNMPASVKNLNLVINNCTLEGAIAVQCWGDNNTITITNSELICNYTTNAMYTSYCVALQSDGYNVAENNTLVIDNCKFKYSGIDNFNSKILGVDDIAGGNTVTVTNCTYDSKVVAE